MLQSAVERLQVDSMASEEPQNSQDGPYVIVAISLCVGRQL